MGTYIKEPDIPGSGLSSSSSEHLDGVPWFEAPYPRRLHRCWAQTIGWINWFNRVERCACGAIRGFGDRRWRERNSSRRTLWKQPPATPYIERKQAEMDRLQRMLDR